MSVLDHSLEWRPESGVSKGSIERPDALPLRPKLAFAGAAYEQSFLRYYHAFYYRYAQASLVVGMVLIFGDFLVDHLAFPDGKANFYRLQVCLPILAIGVAYSFTRFARRHWQFVMSGFIAAVACSMFWVLLMIDSQGGMGLKSWVGMLNFVFLEFYCFVILGVQFRYAIVSGAAILLMFEAAMQVAFGNDFGMFCYWSYHVITLFILAAGIGWWREFAVRMDFATQTTLKVTQDFLKNQNGLLEIEVEKRTRKTQDAQDATIVVLASLVETRDNETGNHIAVPSIMSGPWRGTCRRIRRLPAIWWSIRSTSCSSPHRFTTSARSEFQTASC